MTSRTIATSRSCGLEVEAFNASVHYASFRQSFQAGCSHIELAEEVCHIQVARTSV
jgi:hypothetical protein